MVYLDEMDINEINLCLYERPSIPTAEQDIEHIEIKGRNGSLTKKYGYKDINYPITFNFLENDNFKKYYREIKPHFFNAKKLSFSDDKEVYYKIKSLTFNEADNDIAEYGLFTVNFVLDPFIYELENPIQTITSRTVINNEGHESEPIIIVTCAGTGTMYINDIPTTIQNINGTITIDSEQKNAYRKAGALVTNLNKHMIGDFPILRHGNNVIEFDGDISQIELITNKRWL